MIREYKTPGPAAKQLSVCHRYRFLDNSFANLFVHHAVAGDRDIRMLYVEYAALVKQLGKALARSYCHASRTEIMHPRLECCQARIEKHDDAVGPEVGQGRIAVDRAAASGNDAVSDGKSKQDVFFNLSEHGVPVSIDNFLQGTPLRRLDKHVRIHEIAGCLLGEEYADRTLAGTRHADQYKV